MIVAMRHLTKTVWHLREVDNKLADQVKDKSAISVNRTDLRVHFPCGVRLRLLQPLDKKCYVAFGDFHTLDKKGLCKRCAKRLKDYAKYQIIHSQAKGKIQLGQFNQNWISTEVYNPALNTFNRNFYNNLSYLQKIQ